MAKFIKVKATFNIPTIDLHGWMRQNHDKQIENLREATIAWLGAATDLIPHWSGASLTTFSKLAAQVNFSLGIPGPVSAYAARVSRKRGYFNYPSKGKFGSPKKGVFEAEYDSQLPHLIYNEYNDANTKPDRGLLGTLRNPGPYQFQIIAKTAAEEVMKRQNIPLPKLKIVQTIRVS